MHLVKYTTTNLSYQSRRRCSLVLEGRRELLFLDVVSGETVNTGLDEDHSAACVSVNDLFRR